MSYAVYKLESSLIFIIVLLKNSISQPPATSVYTVCIFYYMIVCFGKRAGLQSKWIFFLRTFSLICRLPEDGNLWLPQREIKFLSRMCSEYPEFINLLNHIIRYAINSCWFFSLSEKDTKQSLFWVPVLGGLGESHLSSLFVMLTSQAPWLKNLLEWREHRINKSEVMGLIPVRVSSVSSIPGPWTMLMVGDHQMTGNVIPWNLSGKRWRRCGKDTEGKSGSQRFALLSDRAQRIKVRVRISWL